MIKMHDCFFLSTYNKIDWQKLIDSLNSQDGKSITTDPNIWNLDTSGYSEIYQMWEKANFNAAAIKWTNYYTDVHYPTSVILELQSNLKLSGVHRSWISRVDPGYYAPWHWDVDDNEKSYLKYGEPKRFSIMIGKSSPGQIFIIGKDYLFNYEQGSIFQWKNYKEWHCGINASMNPKYMLHLLAY